MSLPPIDHVARALVAEGAREHALALLEAAAGRPGPDRARCEALLGAMRARPDDAPSGPMVRLDAILVEALAAAGMLAEARAVARGVRLASRGGVEIASALERVLEPPPASLQGPQRASWEQVIAGRVAGLEPLERDPSRCDPWLRARVPLAARLLRGFSVHAPTGGASDDVEVPRLSPALRATIADRVAARDLPGALAAARSAPASEPGRTEMIVALARLVAATERLSEDPPVAGKGTVPLGGHGFVLFQLRMGNLGDAERALRRIVLEQVNDHVAQERLRDLILVRGAIDAGDAAAPAAPAGWLDKRKARPTGEGWAPAAKPTPVPPARNEWDEEVATSVLRPEQEAELLLRDGQAERALAVYRLVLVRYPDRAEIAARIAEIEAMLEQGRAPIAGEVTVQRDVRAMLASREAERSQAVRLDPPSEGELPVIADDEPTLLGRRPKALMAPDPLAETQDPARPARPAATEAAADAGPGPGPGVPVAVHRIVRIG